MNSKAFFSIVLSLSFLGLFAQSEKPIPPTRYGSVTPSYVSSFAQQIKDGTLILVDQNAPIKAASPKRMGKNKIIPNKGLPKDLDPLVQRQEETPKSIGRTPSLVFDADVSSHSPSDPTAAVGMNYYVAAWNTGFRIFNKHNGSPVIAETSLATLFPGNLNGDPIVFYDAAADRFIITEFSGWNSGSNGFNVAVCTGSDPVNDGWYTYFFSSPSFLDYPKFSVWSDGYYVTTNTEGTNHVFALERSQMLNGTTAQFVGKPLPGLQTSGEFFSPQIFNVCDDNLPATGNATVVYFQDDAWSGVSTDRLMLWNFNVDWATLSNTSVTGPTLIPVSPFTSVFDDGEYSNLSQPPGTPSRPDVDALQATIMNQAQFRKFDTHNSAVFNFVVDTNIAVEKAGIRWYELRQTGDGQPWTLYQEGTYVSPSKHAFNASLAMDIVGNIGMAYTTVSTTEHIAIHYTGRYDGDPLGTMTVSEQLIKQGSSYDPTDRYADYSQLTVDPANNRGFWHISEYFDPERKDVVGVFQLAPSNPVDQGVTQINTPVDGPLTNNEIISVTVKNYGDYDISSGFMVNYQIDSGPIINQAFSGTLDSDDTSLFTFTTTADLSLTGHTYTIDSWTWHPSDNDISNDHFIKQVTNFYQNDVGVVAITAPPTAGSNLDMETITATIQNFGALPQSNFNVSYILDGSAPVVEQVTGTLSAGASTSFSFSTQGDFSSISDHNLSVTTALASDGNPMNDGQSVIISNASCTTVTNNTSQTINPNAGSVTTSIIDIPFNIFITDLNVTLNITHGRDADLDIFLMGPDGSQNALSVGNGGTGQNYDNTTFDDQALIPISAGTAPFTGNYMPDQPLNMYNGMLSQGPWTLSIFDNVNGFGGSLNAWALTLCYDTGVGIDENELTKDGLTIAAVGNNHFWLTVNASEEEENIKMTVYNILGQTYTSGNLKKDSNGWCTYDLDMAFAAPGVYLIKLESTVNRVKRILVK